MLSNQASVKRNGVQDFVSLRTTAIIIAAYTFFIATFFVITDEITYEVWRGFFAHLGTKVFTMAALVSIMIHVRIGLWQVLTDYVKSAGLRTIIQYLLNVVAFAYVVVGLFVLLEL